MASKKKQRVKRSKKVVEAQVAVDLDAVLRDMQIEVTEVKEETKSLAQKQLETLRMAKAIMLGVLAWFFASGASMRTKVARGVVGAGLLCSLVVVIMAVMKMGLAFVAIMCAVACFVWAVFNA